MNITLTNKQFDKILEKQCKMVNADYKKVFKNYLSDKPMPQDWFLQYCWTQKQEDKFKKWLINYLYKLKKYNKTILSKYASMWCFNYGWRYDK